MNLLKITEVETRIIHFIGGRIANPAMNNPIRFIQRCRHLKSTNHIAPAESVSGCRFNLRGGDRIIGQNPDQNESEVEDDFRFHSSSAYFVLNNSSKSFF